MVVVSIEEYVMDCKQTTSHQRVVIMSMLLLLNYQNIVESIVMSVTKLAIKSFVPMEVNF